MPRLEPTDPSQREAIDTYCLQNLRIVCSSVFQLPSREASIRDPALSWTVRTFQTQILCLSYPHQPGVSPAKHTESLGKHLPFTTWVFPVLDLFGASINARALTCDRVNYDTGMSGVQLCIAPAERRNGITWILPFLAVSIKPIILIHIQDTTTSLMPPGPHSQSPSFSAIFSRGHLSDTVNNFNELKTQWRDPRDILTILTVIGGDIVRGALAQLCSSGPRHFTPVALSFGWVSYSFSAILAAIGSRRLAPDPDCPCTLIEVETKYPRDVRSWVLSRVVRDYNFKGPEPRGLTVSFYQTVLEKTMGVPDRDWVYWTGVLVIVIQLSIAVIPGALSGNWVILILTFGGIVLVQLQASLPQWKKEMWAGRKIDPEKPEVVCLTRGNGSAFAMVIRNRSGIRMSDMASGREVLDKTTVPATLILAVLWLIHLFCTAGLESDSWYSLAIGAIGMVQNALASGVRRRWGALGIHLMKVNEVHENKVFRTLMAAEEVEKNVGVVLTDIYFPGGLRADEEKWKQEKINSYSEKS
ncbi:hypothetical protein B0H19DRAFT_1100579 [Mycena capillaripes]|nr:hypothetical protein B0H19DRAFT_1100579 [Mycena capillaripes]